MTESQYTVAMRNDIMGLNSYPRIFAVVLNWQGQEDTERCVESLERTSFPGLQIVVVDNGSTDGSAEYLRTRFSHHHVILRKTNGGFAAGNNEGIRYAINHGAEFVLVMNNDVTVEPSFLEPMVRRLVSNESVGVVTCRAYLAHDHSKPYTTAGTFSYWRCNTRPLPLHLRGKEMIVDFICGCAFLVRRKVFETVGLLDERFFLYFEDIEFSLRVVKTFKMVYVPDGIIYHKSGGGTNWWDFNERYLYYTTRNRFWAFHASPAFFRVYVFFFSFTLACAKSAAVIVSLVLKKSQQPVGPRLWGIWRGLKDGLRVPSSNPA